MAWAKIGPTDTRPDSLFRLGPYLNFGDISLPAFLLHRRLIVISLFEFFFILIYFSLFPVVSVFSVLKCSFGFRKKISVTKFLVPNLAG